MAQFSDLWIWGVANLRFNYLRCFSINFENCCAHLAANFLYFPNIPNFLYLDGFEETYGQKTKNIGNQKNANLSKSWNLIFFDDEISKLFFHSYGPRIPKWNFAHHLSFMVQTSPKHQENPLEYLIYRPLLQIMTNRPPCIYWVFNKTVRLDKCEIGRVWDWKSLGLEECRIGRCRIGRV